MKFHTEMLILIIAFLTASASSRHTLRHEFGLDDRDQSETRPIDNKLSNMYRYDKYIKSKESTDLAKTIESKFSKLKDRLKQQTASRQQAYVSKASDDNNPGNHRVIYPYEGNEQKAATLDMKDIYIREKVNSFINREKSKPQGMKPQFSWANSLRDDQLQLTTEREIDPVNYLPRIPNDPSSSLSRAQSRAKMINLLLQLARNKRQIIKSKNPSNKSQKELISTTIYSKQSTVPNDEHTINLTTNTRQSQGQLAPLYSRQKPQQSSDSNNNSSPIDREKISKMVNSIIKINNSKIQSDILTQLFLDNKRQIDFLSSRDHGNC